MRRVNTGNSEQLVYLEGGGCVICIGLAFLVAGCFFVVLSWTEPVSFKPGESSGVTGSILGSLFCLPFILLGAAVTFGLGGMTFDKKTRTVRRWWGIRKLHGTTDANDGAPANLRILYRSNPSHFRDRAQVTIDRQVRNVTGDRNRREQLVFVVALKGEPVFRIVESLDEIEARHQAEEVAGFLGVDLLDRSSGTRVLREAGTLDQPLRQRAARANLPATLPPGPENMRTGFQVEDDRLTFTAPREPFDPFLLAHLIAPALFSYFAYIFLRQTLLIDLAPGETAKAIIPVVFLVVLPPVFGMLGFVSNIYWGGTVAVTADRLRVTTRGKIFNRSADISIVELDELRVGKAKTSQWQVSLGGFNVRSDPDAPTLELQAITKQVILRFGRGLPQAELEWIREVLMKTITA